MHPGSIFKFAKKIGLLSAIFICGITVQNAQAMKIENGRVVLEKLDDFENCQGLSYSGKPCMDALDSWLQSHSEDYFNAGKKVRRAMNHWAAVPYFYRSINSQQGFCKDPDVWLAVKSALSLPEIEKTPIHQAKEIAFGKCLGDMKDGLSEISEDQFLKNSCAELLKAKLLKGVKEKKCKIHST